MVFSSFLHQSYVRQYSHLEYSHGFIIFDRYGSQLEAWQRVADSPHTTSAPNTDTAQAEAWEASPYRSYTSNRGIYQPFAVLSNPNHIHAYRFIYPDLLVVSRVALEAYIWDIPTATLVQTLSLSGGGGWLPSPPFITYVEISKDHIFVCWTSCITVHSRRTGEKVFQLPDGPDTPRARCMEACTVGDIIPRGLTRGLVESKQFQLATPSRLLEEYCFTAVHVSPSGQALVGVTESGHVFYIPDFINCRNLEDDVKVVKMQSDIIYMAYDGRRIAFCSVSIYFSGTISQF